MKKLLIPVFLIWLTGSSACTEQSDCCTNNALNIDVAFQNAVGADMLDPSTSGHLTTHDVSVFYEIDGKLETYVSLNEGTILDNPKGFALQSDGTKNFLHVFSNPTLGNHVVTLITIEDRPEIRLVTQVVSNHGRQITNLWHNDELVWSNTMSRQFSPYVMVKLD